MEFNQKMRVLVGAPISDLHEYCLDEFISSIKSLTYPNYDILLIDNSKTKNLYNKLKNIIPIKRIPYVKEARKRVTKSHNILRKHVLDNNYDYLLNLDQDTIPPRDVIEKLLRHNKKFISGLYFGHHTLETGENKIMPFAWVFTEKKDFWGKVRYLDETEIWKPGLIKIAFAGAGCLLIHKDILKKIKFKYNPKIDAWDDRWIAYEAYKHGFEVFLDNTVRCKHLYLNRPFKWTNIKEKGAY